jgi:CPA2 family monovalent cation:H+ antiporter-2
VVLPAFAVWLDGSPDAAEGQPGLLMTIAVTLGEVALFIALMVVVGRRVFPWLLWQVARTGSRELFTLCVIAVAVGIAYGSSVLFGVSFALGAFFAGIVMRESELSHRAADESLPLRDAFSVLFFVSVGMLFDPQMLVLEPLRILVVLSIIVVGKTVAAFALVLAFRYPLNTALTVSASLAQIGEFSFILASLGVALNLLPTEGQDLILAGALLSIALNPVLFNLIEPAQAWIRERSRIARFMERTRDPLAKLPPSANHAKLEGHVVLVGFGRVGERIGSTLIDREIPFVVVEQNRDVVTRLRERGLAAVRGDAADPRIAAQAHVGGARLLVIAVPDAFGACKIAATARALRPSLEMVARAHSDEEADLLRKETTGMVFMGEHELALGMTRHVLERLGAK